MMLVIIDMVSSYFWSPHLWALSSTWANPPPPPSLTVPQSIAPPTPSPSGDTGPLYLKRSELLGCWQMHRYYIHYNYFVNKLITLSLYKKSFRKNNIINKVKCIYWFNYRIVVGSQKSNKIMSTLTSLNWILDAYTTINNQKLMNYACFKLEEENHWKCKK